MLRNYIFISFVFLCVCNDVVASQACKSSGTWLQVLGSGGPELDDNRASSSYLIWHQGKAKFLIDMGSGSMFNFEKSAAKIESLEAIMLSHLHVDHSSDLPALIKASFFTGRNKDLQVFGPTGNHIMPSLTHFIESLFGANGAYQYLTSYLDGTDAYRIVARNIDVDKREERVVLTGEHYKLMAVPVNHGPIPALAWKAEVYGKSIVFSGDMSNKYNALAHLATNAEMLVAHNAIPESAQGVARNLHMPPSVIGEIASQANVKQLVVSHRMKRTTGNEKNTIKEIRKHYKGLLQFADDLQCFAL